MTFTELHMPDTLVAALAKQGITTPMPVQEAALPVLLDGKDAYIHSETGTGKTLAYLLPLFCRIDPQQAATQLVVVAPTHELAIQIQRQACDLAQNAGLPLRTLLLIGGTALDRQIEKLKKKPQIVVGSPGRIRELIAKGKLKAHAIRTVVVDEADRVLCDENVEHVRRIILAAPRQRQLVFVSATEQKQCEREIAGLSPAVVRVSAAAAPINPNIEHLFLVCEERDKPDVMRRLFHALKPARAIAFVHRNEMAEEVAAKLAWHQVPVADLHGAFDKNDRKRAMDGIRSGEVRVLIASDLAARGLDIPGVTHIFNLDAPAQSKAYLHRVGRTARAGAKGVAVSLFTVQELRLVRRYETDLGIAMTEVRLREGRVVPANAAT